MTAFFIEITCVLNIFYIKIKNMNDSKVSILIPLYNAEKYISETIDSKNTRIGSASSSMTALLIIVKRLSLKRLKEITSSNILQKRTEDLERQEIMRQVLQQVNIFFSWMPITLYLKIICLMALIFWIAIMIMLYSME